MNNNVYINRQEIVDYIKQNGLVYATTLETWPAADVLEVVRGEWLRSPSEIATVDIERCSVCGCEMSERNQFWNANFCPNCGADMRGNHQ